MSPSNTQPPYILVLPLELRVFIMPIQHHPLMKTFLASPAPQLQHNSVFNTTHPPVTTSLLVDFPSPNDTQTYFQPMCSPRMHTHSIPMPHSNTHRLPFIALHVSPSTQAQVPAICPSIFHTPINSPCSMYGKTLLICHTKVPTPPVSPSKDADPTCSKPSVPTASKLRAWPVI